MRVCICVRMRSHSVDICACVRYVPLQQLYFPYVQHCVCHFELTFLVLVCPRQAAYYCRRVFTSTAPVPHISTACDLSQPLSVSMYLWVYVCMCVYVPSCVCMHVCICLRVHIYVLAASFHNLGLYQCIYVFTCVCVSMYLHVYVCMYV